jgi:hypothetical protein
LAPRHGLVARGDLDFWNFGKIIRLGACFPASKELYFWKKQKFEKKHLATAPV